MFTKYTKVIKALHKGVILMDNAGDLWKFEGNKYLFNIGPGWHECTFDEKDVNDLGPFSVHKEDDYD